MNLSLLVLLLLGISVLCLAISIFNIGMATIHLGRAIAVHWLERLAGGDFTEVGYNSASRRGEPFAELIRQKNFAPNGVTRFCTSELKIRVMRDFAQAQGWARWTNVIGLRYDEGLRVLKAIDRSESGKDHWRNAMPLSTARVMKREVKTFWLGPSMAFPAREMPQGFDLGLYDYEGNCDLCFLKSRHKREALIRERPASADWWIAQEEAIQERFVTEHSYADLARTVANQPMLTGLLEVDDGEEADAECGLICV